MPSAGHQTMVWMLQSESSANAHKQEGEHSCMRTHNYEPACLPACLNARAHELTHNGPPASLNARKHTRTPAHLRARTHAGTHERMRARRSELTLTHALPDMHMQSCASVR